MGRKRIDLGHEVEGQIRALMARGGTVESITAALVAGGVKGASSATIGRRMRELRGEVNAGRAERLANSRPPLASTPPPPIPSAPEEIPEGASLSELASLRTRCKEALDMAEAESDLKLVGQLIRVQASLEDLIRKATPAKAADPNDSPDMAKLGAEVAERLHKMVDLVCG
jgi:hypothetical protein